MANSSGALRGGRPAIAGSAHGSGSSFARTSDHLPFGSQEYDNYFCVVDLHAITAPHVPKELTKDTYRTWVPPGSEHRAVRTLRASMLHACDPVLSRAALYLASGIDPAKSKVFVQSHVTAHAELTWLLNCATPMGWLEKMIQYKEKKAKQVGCRRRCPRGSPPGAHRAWLHACDTSGRAHGATLSRARAATSTLPTCTPTSSVAQHAPTGDRLGRHGCYTTVIRPLHRRPPRRAARRAASASSTTPC